MNEFTRVGTSQILSPVSLETSSLSSFLKEYLDITNSKSESPVTLYVRGYGGDLDTAFSIYEIMQQNILSETILIGRAKSAHAILFCAGTMRYIAKSGSIGLHPCLSSLEYMQAKNAKRVISDAEDYDRRVLETLTVSSRWPYLTWQEHVEAGNENFMNYLNASELHSSGIGDLIIPAALIK